MRRKLHVRRASAFVLVAGLAAVALVGGSASQARAVTPNDAVLDWNRYTADALINAPAAPTPGLGQGPTVAILHLAMVQGAVYDAVNMIDGGHEAYLDDLPTAPSSASKSAAVATAAHGVLVGVSMTPPLTSTIIDRLDDLYDDSIDAALLEDGATAVAAGIAAGQAAAAKMLSERAADGRYGTFRFTCGDDPGEWRPTTSLGCPTPPGLIDPASWVARVTPFVLESPSQFRSKGPHDMTSGAYAKDYNEVKALGAVGSQRTPEQSALAGFFTNTTHPPEMYNRTFRTVASSEGLTLVKQARLFAMLNLAGADALINCWDDKAHWSFWRPQTAIRLGDQDGNPKTEADPGWTSLSGNPPYPDHPSGYNCVTGAFMHTGAAFFGKKPLTFDMVRIVAGEPNQTRTYRQFTDVIDDTIDARVYIGIHFRAPDVQGAEIGKDVARWLNQNFFRPAK